MGRKDCSVFHPSVQPVFFRIGAVLVPIGSGHGAVASRPIHLNDGVKALELDPRSVGCELPIGFGVAGVPVAHPGGDLLGEGLFVWDAPIQAL